MKRGVRSLLAGGCLLLGGVFSTAAFADGLAGCPIGYQCAQPIQLVYNYVIMSPYDAKTNVNYPSPQAACTAANEKQPGVAADITTSSCQYNQSSTYCDCTVTLTDPGTDVVQSSGPAQVGPIKLGLVQCQAGMTYSTTTGLCQSQEATCPVAPLTPITDPLAQENESGQYSTQPDMEHATPAIQTAAQCVVAAAQSYAPGGWARVNSAFRPQTYQNHIREVWDKWMLLKDNNMPQCAALKARVIQEKEQKHHLVHQPGVTSQYTVGKAMDLSISPYSDNMRAYLRQHCNLKQPVPTDKVHYEPN